MQTRGVLVDYRAVNTAMSACAKAQQWSMVLKLYDQVREWLCECMCVCLCVCVCECVCMRARTDKKRKIKCTSHSYVALSSYSSMTSFGPFHLDDLSLHLSLSSVPFFFYHYATSSILFPLPSSYTHLPTSLFLPPYLHCTLADANSHRSSICS